MGMPHSDLCFKWPARTAILGIPQSARGPVESVGKNAAKPGPEPKPDPTWARPFKSGRAQDFSKPKPPKTRPRPGLSRPDPTRPSLPPTRQRRVNLSLIWFASKLKPRHFWHRCRVYLSWSKRSPRSRACSMLLPMSRCALDEGGREVFELFRIQNPRPTTRVKSGGDGGTPAYLSIVQRNRSAWCVEQVLGDNSLRRARCTF
ncbi:hypothetical protein DFH09DRAFT_83981 [Mycena vulgaris]|nr:hypothetical protein DFH09DRAFT_83981 [Mycena vulgaris]